MQQLKINHNFASPNFGSRPNKEIDTIVIHYTEMASEMAAIQKLCDPDAIVSAHYVIAKSGEIFQLVEDEKRAHHAGQSWWQGRNNVNDFSIGIELDNNGNEPFTPDLMNSLILLCLHLVEKYQIQPFNIVAHSDIAPLRKIDPGIYFDWLRLADNKIGIMPRMNLFKPSNKQVDIKYIALLLTKFGYEPALLEKYDAKMIECLKAFSIHFLREEFQEANLEKISYALEDILAQIEIYEA